MVLTKMLLFLAIPPIYFNFLVSSSSKKDVLLPEAESIKTIPGLYPRLQLRSIDSKAKVGFCLNFGSFFPSGNELPC